jgi:cyanophycinase-like exopeptidase
MDWFRSLGAANAASVPLIDGTSADDPAIEEALLQSRLIFLLGGFPSYLEQTLQGSRGWQAIVSAYQGGAVIAGSSAEAMVEIGHRSLVVGMSPCITVERLNTEGRGSS